jgi:hypothetical protein
MVLDVSSSTKYWRSDIDCLEIETKVDTNRTEIPDSS